MEYTTHNIKRLKNVSGYIFIITLEILSSKVITHLTKDMTKTQMALNLIEVRLEKNLLSPETLENLLFECQCALFMISSQSKINFDKVVELLKIIKSNKVISTYEYLTLILLENKIDLGSSEYQEEINELIKSYKAVNREKDKDLFYYQISLKEVSSNPKSLASLVEVIYEAENNPNNRVALNVISISTSKQALTAIPIKLVLLGDSGVGKTALITRHFKDDFNETFLSTIGIGDESENVKVRDELFKLQVWDTAGQYRFRCLPKQYYQNADGILMVFSVDIRESFTNVSRWMNEIENNSNKNTLVYLIGNKCDIEERVVTRKEAEEVAKLNNIDYYEISCKNNINIDEVICKMVLSCYSKATGCLDVFSLKQKKVVKSGNCCGGNKNK